MAKIKFTFLLLFNKLFIIDVEKYVTNILKIAIHGK